MLLRQLSLLVVHRAPGSPLRLLLLDAAGHTAAPLSALPRDVLVARHSLVPIVAHGLKRRPRRPLLDAVSALAALDAALALLPSSSLAAATAHVGAEDTSHNTLNNHVSLLLTHCVTRERLCHDASVTHHHVMHVARRQRARALSVDYCLARLAHVSSSSISSPHAAHLAARSLGLSTIGASDQQGRRTASS